MKGRNDLRQEIGDILYTHMQKDVFAFVSTDHFFSALDELEDLFNTGYCKPLRVKPELKFRRKREAHGK